MVAPVRDTSLRTTSPSTTLISPMSGLGLEFHTAGHVARWGQKLHALSDGLANWVSVPLVTASLKLSRTSWECSTAASIDAASTSTSSGLRPIGRTWINRLIETFSNQPGVQQQLTPIRAIKSYVLSSYSPRFVVD